MAGIQKRVRTSGTTTYVVRWNAPDGTERTKGGFRTKKAAEDYAAIHVEPKRRRGIDVNPMRGRCCSATRRRSGSRTATT
jgi:hypothetical protein